MAGKPLTRSGKTCTAIKKNGERCQSKKLYKGEKCKYHGGLSLNAEEKAKITAETGREFRKTGPATPDGWARTLAGFRRWVEERRKAREQRCPS